MTPRPAPTHPTPPGQLGGAGIFCGARKIRGPACPAANASDAGAWKSYDRHHKWASACKVLSEMECTPREIRARGLGNVKSEA